MLQFNFSKCSLADSEIQALDGEAARVHEILKKERESGQVGFWNLPFDEQTLVQVRNVAQNVRSRFQNLLVLGIGGSSNGLKALSRALCPSDNHLRLMIQESPDPIRVEKIIGAFPWEKTCINVISKSGATIETWTLFEYFLKLLKEKVKHWQDHVVVTCEEGANKLYPLVQKEKLLHFEIPKNIVGRYSVFSAVGLFPLACIGVDIQKLVQGAAKATEEITNACRNGLVHYLLNKDHGKTISVMMVYGDSLRDIGGWYAQLWAESLGKDGKGQTPIAAQGPQDQHSLAQLLLDGPKDKVVTFITVAPQKGNRLSELMDRECQATAQALSESGVPSVTITLPEISEEVLGKLLMTYQIQTAFTGHLMGVNPYDQPAVERVKRLT